MAVPKLFSVTFEVRRKRKIVLVGVSRSDEDSTLRLEYYKANRLSKEEQVSMLNTFVQMEMAYKAYLSPPPPIAPPPLPANRPRPVA